MAEIEIEGTNRYIKYLSKHLKHEHPSTKKRMEVELDKPMKKFKSSLKQSSKSKFDFKPDNKWNPFPDPRPKPDRYHKKFCHKHLCPHPCAFCSSKKRLKV